MAGRSGAVPFYLTNHKQRLDLNRKLLLDDIIAEDILDQLLQDGIIDHDDDERIKSEKTRKDKATALLDIIYHRGPNAYKCFRAVLLEKSDWLVAELDETKINESSKKIEIKFDINTKTMFTLSHHPMVMQNWKSLALLLEVSNTDLVNIEYSNRGPLSDAVHEMLMMWQTRKGKLATPKALGEALIDTNMQGVLDELNS